MTETLQIGKLTLPREHAQAILAEMIQLRAQGPTILCSGICFHLHEAITARGMRAATYPLVEALAPSWPEYSGDAGYPVPSYREDKTAEQAYRATAAGKWDLDKWDRETEYGAARWRLLDHLIATLEKELAP